MTQDRSRRDLIMGAGALTVAVSMGSAAFARPTASRSWVARIGVAAPQAVADVGASLGARPRRVATRHLSPGIRAASLGLAGVDVEIEEPMAPELATSLADDGHDYSAALLGGLVGLEAHDPDLIAARARKAGIRVFRDLVVAGQRVIALEAGPLGARFEIVGASSAAPARLPTQVTGVVIACAEPRRAAALAGAIFEARVQDAVANLSGFPVRFVRSAPSGREGVIALDLAGASRLEVRV